MNKLNLKINDTAIGDMEKISDYIARDDVKFERLNLVVNYFIKRLKICVLILLLV